MSILSEPLGRVLGNRYRLVSALGTGASAHVFLAEDMVLQRRVAVKVLQPALVRDEGFLRRFRAEARSVAAMNHPHVLRVFDWGEDDDGPYLVLEYLEGGSLYDMLARGARLAPAQAARVGVQAAEGLAYAHGRGLVHRDVKPANILFDEEGRVRVADFGVARALAGAALTEPVGTMVGTARYASPEQAQGRPLDGRSDVYSLGLVLFEAVTGSIPFDGDTPLAMLQARIGATLPHAPGLGALSHVLPWASSPDHEVRPDAASLALRLETVADALGAAPPLPLARRAPLPGAGLGAGLGSFETPMGPGTLIDTTMAAGAGPVVVDPFARTGPVGTAAAGPGLPGGPGALVGFGGPGRPGEHPTAAVVVGGQRSGTSRARRRRRWPWLVGILAVVALLLAAGAVYAVRTKLFTPSHPVPSLVGDSLAAARSAVAGDHFHLVVEPAVHSITVPSGSVVRQDPAKGSSLKQGATVQVVPSSGVPTVTVPSLSGGVSCAVATRLLAEVHLKAQCPASQAYTSTVPSGEVISWSYATTSDPTTAPYGATIAIAISEGKPPVSVPTEAGRPATQAAGALRSLGLTVKQTQSYSTTVPSGQVISTTPGPGNTIPYGSSVTLDVSEGVHMVTVPDVTKDTVAQATTIIEKAGLTVGQVYGPATGTVFTSVPLAGQQEKAGSPVTLYTQ